MIPSSHARLRALRAAAVGALGVLLAACNRTQVVQGECRKVNGADICTWGELSGTTLTAFGASVPVASIQNAPADPPMVWPPVADATIPLPDAVRTATGFAVLSVYWEAHGHPPGPFLIPHFDFHFYHASSAEIAAIDCADSLKPAALAAGYALPDMAIPGIGMLVGLCVPHMGMHSLPQADIDAKEPFQKTTVVGYYRQHPIFVEPMIASATLLARHSFTMDIPAVPGQPANVHSPMHFRADYDSTALAYRFVFTDFNGAGAR